MNLSKISYFGNNRLNGHNKNFNNRHHSSIDDIKKFWSQTLNKRTSFRKNNIYSSFSLPYAKTKIIKNLINKSYPLSPPSSDHSPFTYQDSNSSDLEGVGGCSDDDSLCLLTKHPKYTDNPRSLKRIRFMGKTEKKSTSMSPHQIISNDSMKPIKILDSHINSNLNIKTNGLLKKPAILNSPPYPVENGIIRDFKSSELLINCQVNGYQDECLKLQIIPDEIAFSPKSDLDPTFLNNHQTTDDMLLFTDVMMNNDPSSILLFEDSQKKPDTLNIIHPKLDSNHIDEKCVKHLNHISDRSQNYVQSLNSSLIQEYQDTFKRSELIDKQLLLEKRHKNILIRIKKLQTHCVLKHAKNEIDLYNKKNKSNLIHSELNSSTQQNKCRELISQIRYYCDQDSDKTDVSSDEESFEDLYSVNYLKPSNKTASSTFQNLKYDETIWKWEQTRAAIAKQWVWLQHKIQTLETKINHQKDIHFHFRAIKGNFKFTNQTFNNPLLHDTCARSRPLCNPYLRRKLYANSLISNAETIGMIPSYNSLLPPQIQSQHTHSILKSYPWFNSNLSNSRVPLPLLYNIAIRTKPFVQEIEKFNKPSPIILSKSCNVNSKSTISTTSSNSHKQASSILRRKKIHSSKLAYKNQSSFNKSFASGNNKQHRITHPYYDIDDMDISFNTSNLNSLIIPQFKKILTPKWKTMPTQEFESTSDQNILKQDFLNETLVKETHTKYQLKEKYDRTHISKKRSSSTTSLSSTTYNHKTCKIIKTEGSEHDSLPSFDINENGSSNFESTILPGENTDSKNNIDASEDCKPDNGNDTPNHIITSLAGNNPLIFKSGTTVLNFEHFKSQFKSLPHNAANNKNNHQNHVSILNGFNHCANNPSTPTPNPKDKIEEESSNIAKNIILCPPPSNHTAPAMNKSDLFITLDKNDTIDNLVAKDDKVSNFGFTRRTFPLSDNEYLNLLDECRLQLSLDDKNEFDFF
ncbi:unnamed protein product [Gordionus sp. m RMFG-2023]|uniref:uncharacterized protein LOC135929551 n=1 Tax=Gordionus sp. m RMFG-2023 TaxID=3053472 RepID=UPI0030DE80D0